MFCWLSDLISQLSQLLGLFNYLIKLIISQAQAQAQARPSPAQAHLLGWAQHIHRPKPTKAQPKPRLLSLAWPSTSLGLSLGS